MSSPIHHVEDLDPALRYAPPWARRQDSPPSGVPSDPSHGWRRNRQRVGRERSAFSGDLAMQELQRQLALNPDKVPEPPFEASQNLWPMVRRICALAGVAAIVAGAIVLLPNARKPAARTAQAEALPALNTANHVKIVHIHMNAEAAPVASVGLDSPNASPAQSAMSPSSPPQNSSSSPPQNSSSSSPQNSSALIAERPQSSPDHSADAIQNSNWPIDNTPALDGDEIAMMIKRGQDLLQNGDLASARLLLQRAANTGSADAAFALGATFDPIVIQKLGVIGIEPDRARAREWYEKAAALGSAVAAQKLAGLGPQAEGSPSGKH